MADWTSWIHHADDGFFCQYNCCGLKKGRYHYVRHGV
jgi:hypothetical protein